MSIVVATVEHRAMGLPGVQALLLGPLGAGSRGPALERTAEAYCEWASLLLESNASNTLAPFMPPPLFDAEALYAALDAKRRSKDISWRKAAEEIGISASTLTRMAQGAHPDVEGFGKMVRWLGEPADQFIAGGQRRPRVAKTEDLRVVVSRHLRASKELPPESARALETIIEAAYRQMKGLKAD